MLWEVIAAEKIEELIDHPRLAHQLIDDETFKMTHADSSLDFFFDIVDYPRHRSVYYWFSVSKEEDI